MKYTWVYLCCNPKMLELTLTYLPREKPFKNLRCLMVIYPAHIVSPTLEWVEATHYAPTWLTHLEFKGISEVPEKLQDTRFMEYWDNPRPGWSLGIKQLVPLLVEDPILYTDDDVLVVQDPWNIISRGPFCTAGGFNRVSISVKTMYMLETINAVFDTDLDFFTFNERIVDAGIWFINQRDDYLALLRKFWLSKYYATLLKASTTEFRCADQRFLTGYGTIHNWNRITKSSERRVWYQSLAVLKPKPKAIWNTTFLHYGASSHKPDYIRWFKEVIK